MFKVSNIANREFRKLFFTPGVAVASILIMLTAVTSLLAPLIIQRVTPVKYIGFINQYDDNFINEIEAELEFEYRVNAIKGWDLYINLLSQSQPDLFEKIPEYLRPQHISNDRLDAFDAAGGLANANTILKQKFKYAGLLPGFTPPKRPISLVELPIPASFRPDTNFDTVEYRAVIQPWISGESVFSSPAGDKKIDNVMVIQQGVKAVPRVEYWRSSSRPFPIAQLVEDTLSHIAQKHAFAQAGVLNEEFEEISSLSVDVTEFTLDDEGSKTSLSLENFLQENLPFFFAYILFLIIISSGQSLLLSVIEEKSNKIAEVLLSSVSAHQLMIGKLIGNFLASLAFMGILFVIGITLSVVIIRFLPEQVSITKVLFDGPAVFWLLFCFAFGYGFIAAIYLAIGSMFSSIEDAQSLLGPFMIIFLAPLILLVPIIQNPNGIIASVMSFIPLYSPYVLMLRVNNDPPIWEMAGGAIVLVTCTVYAIILMGRIFEKFILDTTFLPKWGQLFKNRQS